MATFHFTLLIGLKNQEGTKKKKEELTSTKKGTFPIYLSVTQNRKLARYKTSVELDSVDYWNPKEEVVRKSCIEYHALNRRLEDLLIKAKEAEDKVKESGEEVTSKAIVDTLRKIENNTLNKSFSFFDFAECNMQELYDLGQYANFQQYNCFIRRLKCFVNGVKPEDVIIRKQNDWDMMQKEFTKDLLFNDITFAFLNAFDKFLHNCPNNCRKGLLLNQNTIRKMMKIFKAIFFRGVNRLEDEGLKIEKNPFSKYECKCTEANVKEKLTLEEIESLKALDLEKDSCLWHARNCFLLAFYCGGVRCGDMVQLRGCFVSKEENCYRLKYTMDKTDKAKNIVLVSEAVEILKEYIDIDNPSSTYIFPYLNNSASYAKAITAKQKDSLSADDVKNLKKAIGSSNALLNKYLKKLAEMSGIAKNISMHIARHSFADLARKNTGSIYDIKSILGHTDIKTTQTYLKKLDTETQDKTMQNVFHREEETERLLKQLKNLDSATLKQLLERL